MSGSLATGWPVAGLLLPARLPTRSQFPSPLLVCTAPLISALMLGIILVGVFVPPLVAETSRVATKGSGGMGLSCGVTPVLVGGVGGL